MGKKGFVYIMTNDSMPGIIKVGMSTKVPTERAKELEDTGLPMPYVVQYYAFFDDMQQAEKKAHNELSKYHYNKEFFKTDVGTAINCIENLGLSFNRLYCKLDKVELYKLALRVDPDDADAHFGLGDANLHFKDRGSALEEYKKLKELDSELADKLFDLIYKEEEELEEEDSDKIDSYKQAIRIDPDDAKAHYNLGTAYDELGKYEDAIVSYKQALMINPDDASTHYNLGLAYYNLGKYEEAIESYKQAIRIDPDYADAHNNLGFAYQKSGKYQEEIESYKQALKIDPDDASVHNNLGYAYYDSGKYQEAIEAYKQVLRIDPDYVKAHGNLGLAYLKSGKYEEAIESYKQALRIDPDSKYAHKSLGYAYHKRGIYRVLEEEWGFDGHSRINHEYNLKTIEGDKVVVDNATGLMWHQSGSDDKMDWNETLMWIEKLNKGSWLNKGGYAGYHDWRLPTVEEAASLLEPSKKNGLYIAPVFSNKQSYIRSSGRHSSGGTWRVLFYDGRVNGSDIFGGGSYYVRPVRSVE
jgi:tetratricopeptide (TPR) repeat protein